MTSFLGFRKFVARIFKRYLPESCDKGRTGQRQSIGSLDALAMTNKVARMLKMSYQRL